MGGHRQEDQFRQHRIRALVAHFGVTARAETQVTCVDRRVQWRCVRTVWRNAAAGTTMYIVTAPVRWVGQVFGA